MTSTGMGLSTVENCDFCVPIADPTADRDWYNFHVIAESRAILAVAALGPLAAGHILLVPREHVASAAQLTEDRYQDLENEWHEWSDRLEQTWGQTVLTFEHGSGAGDEKSTACITHVHWQLVPTDHADAMLSSLNPGLTSVRQVGGARQYLMARAGRETRVQTAGGQPQQIRRSLAAALGQHAFVDYFLFPRLSVMKETIEQLSRVNK